MNVQSNILIASTFAALLALPAVASTAIPAAGHSLSPATTQFIRQRADTEAYADTLALFARLDTPHYGTLSRSEAASDPRLEKEFLTIDRDHNLQISEAEYRDFRAAQLDREMTAKASAASS